MEIEQIKTLLNDTLALDELHVRSEGSHYQVIAVGVLFEGMNRVKKQQTIYAPLMETIAAGTIHALSIKAYTPEEWQREQKFNSPG